MLLTLSGNANAQFNDDPTGMLDIGQSSGTDELGAADHRSDDAFLRRYARTNDAQQLSLSLNSNIKRKLNLSLNLYGNAGGGDNAPFWLTSNRQGLSPVNASGIMLDLGMDGGMRLPSHFYFNYGIDVAVAANYQSDFYLQQIYVDAGYKWFDLSLGAKERWGELVNPQLSSGSLTWSGNSRPIPQIRLEVPEFTRLGILGRWFSLKGHIAYGWYQDNDWRAKHAARYSNPPQYTDRILHHSKSLFLKVGDTERFPLEFTFGLEMYAQFGGVRHNMRTSASDPVVETFEYPHNLKTYLQVFLPVNKPGMQTKDNGNTMGSWHLAFDLTFDKWKYRLYYEHFYEDHSSMLGIESKADVSGDKGLVFYGFRRNWFDGLFGLEINAPEGIPFNNIVFEFLNTKGQCGPVYRYQNPVILEGVDGRDDMYNHEFYKSYSNYGYSNGSPVLYSPIYNKDGDLSFKSNRVIMFHIGIDGDISPHLEYRLLATHTTHWGCYSIPFENTASTTSMLIECFYRFGNQTGWRVGLSAAADFGSSSLPGVNKGLMLSVSKTWRML